MTSPTHYCHAQRCTRPVHPMMFMCRLHWYALPKPMRTLIWATYRPGQERDKQPSKEYLDAADKAIAFIVAKESVGA